MPTRDPIRLFQQWFRAAQRARLPLPESMTLATVGPRGRPAARIVLLKGIQDGEFVFFTNYESRKARELATNPQATLVFHWAPLERQVRVTGQVRRSTRAESAKYFATRPRESQLGAWASHQSSALASRAQLLAQLRAVKRRFPGETPIPCPPYWGGFHVIPDEIEFWHGRPARLHDRLVFNRTGKRWRTRILSP